MRFSLFVSLFSAAFFPTSLPAMSEAEICATMMQDFGYDVGDCIQGRNAAEPQDPAQSLTLETQESHIFFESGGTKISNSAQFKINAITAILNTRIMQNTCIKLIGHSDTTGATNRNFALAQERAELIARLLREGLDQPENIQVVTSAGETTPLPAHSGSNPFNRRVEIRAKTCS